MPGVFPYYAAQVVRSAGAERELILMRWGHAISAAYWRGASDQHPQHVVAAQARR